MMKNFVYGVLCVGVVLGLAQISRATPVVTEIVLEQTQGVTESFDHTTGTVRWQGGSAGFIMFDDLSIKTFTDAYVLAEAYGVVDQSSGGWAEAVFTNGGSFSVTLADDGPTGASFSFIGDVGAYHEVEAGLGDELDGDGILTDLTVWFGTGWFEGTVTELEWAGGSGALLDVDTTLVYGVGFGSYETDDYTSQNSIVTLIVPEPTTICLLAISSIALLRRKKR